MSVNWFGWNAANENGHANENEDEAIEKEWTFGMTNRMAPHDATRAISLG